MARRKNPYVTFALFLAVCGFAWAAWHFVAEEKVFERPVIEAMPAAEVDKIKAALEENLKSDECFDFVGGIGWRPQQQRFRITVGIRDGCGLAAAQRVGKRAQEIVDRVTNGRMEAEISLEALGRQIYLSLP
jgi:hypothetical protein